MPLHRSELAIVQTFVALHEEGGRMLISVLSEKRRSSRLGADTFQTRRIKTHDKTEYLAGGLGSIRANQSAPKHMPENLSFQGTRRKKTRRAPEL